MLLAAMTRTSTLMVSFAPTRFTSPSWRTRSRRTWVAGGTSPISSRKMVPPSAASNRPFLLARAPVVDGPGDQLLAGAALALDEDGGAGVADRLHQLEDRPHLGRLPDEVLELALDAELLLQDAGAVLQLLPLQRLGDGEAHLVDVGEGLGEVVVGAGLHRLDGRLHRGEGGHHHHLHVGSRLLHGLEQVHPGQVRHPDVQHRHVDGGILGGRKAFHGVVDGDDGVTLSLKYLGDCAEDDLVVVDHQDLARALAHQFLTDGKDVGGIGSRTVKVEPSPGALSTSKRPPWSWTMR